MIELSVVSRSTWLAEIADVVAAAGGRALSAPYLKVGRTRIVTLGRPAIGSIRRTSMGGRKLRPKRRKRGAKSVMRIVPPAPSIDRLEDRGVGQIALACPSFAPATAASMKPLLRLGAAQQGIEDRIAVEPAEPVPDVTPVADRSGWRSRNCR